MAYEDKDIQFLYDLIHKTIAYKDTPGLSMLEEIAAGITILDHEMRDAMVHMGKTSKMNDNLREKLKESKDKITNLEIEISQLKGKV